jgi:transcriptional repressor NrdR
MREAARQRRLARSIADRIEHTPGTPGEIDERNRLVRHAGAQKLDKVAYVRFASVYRHFRDIGEFMTELKDLLNAKE